MKTIHWFHDSPDVGNPACLCSWCGLVIKEKDAPPIRMFDNATQTEARFHPRCAGPAIGLNVSAWERDWEDEQ